MTTDPMRRIGYAFNLVRTYSILRIACSADFWRIRRDLPWWSVFTWIKAMYD